MTLYSILLNQLHQQEQELTEKHTEEGGVSGKAPSGMSDKDWHIGDKWMTYEQALLYLREKLKHEVPEKELEHMDVEEMIHKITKELNLKL
jgi:hypothetical protein